MKETSYNVEQGKKEEPENAEKSESIKETAPKDQEIAEQEEAEVHDLSWFRKEIEEDEKMSPREVADAAHDETKEHAIKEYGQYMSKEQIEGLKLDETKNQMEIISREEYFSRFPEMDPNVLGHCEQTGKIVIIADSDEILRHVSTHETTHLCANRESETRDTGDTIIRSGMREVMRNADGEYIADKNQGINEGITQMLTLDELVERGDIEAAYCIECYPDARFWAVRLEEMVGREKIAEAYYGKGQQGLVDEFNRLNYGNPSAWERFSKDIDILTYSSDKGERELAQTRVVNQFAFMAMAKRNLERREE